MDLEVIIVDDDKVILYLHETLVKKEGLHDSPLKFFDGRETLDYISGENANNNHKLILLDINMPVMNAWEFLDELENIETDFELFVVIVTSSVDLSDKQKATEYSLVIDFIEKPVTLDIIRALKNHKKLKKFFTD